MKIALLLQLILWAAPGDDLPSCPTREDVAQAVAQALSPAPSGGASAAGALPANVQITDLGDAFEVAVGKQMQRYPDPARDCVERARAAAVFVALVLSPPAAPARPPAPPPVVAPAPPPPPPPPVRAPLLVRVAAAARFDAATGGGLTGTATGGEARVSVGRHALAVEATAGVLSTMGKSAGGIRIRQQRFPCSVAAVGRVGAGAHVQLAGAAGLSLTPFTVRGEGVMAPVTSTRLDVGPRVELAARWVGHAVSPFAGVHLEWFPRRYDVLVTPLGAIGTTAPLQIGLSLGLELGL